MRVPSGDQAGDRGPSNCRLPEPSDPKAKSKVPSALNTCTRSLPVSATAMRVPSGDQAAEPGLSNLPSPPPYNPNLPANVPLALNTCTRSLPVSATANMPGGGAAGGRNGAKSAELGHANRSSGTPDRPTSKSRVPLG